MDFWSSRAWLRLFVSICGSLLVQAQSPLLRSEPNTTTAADAVITFNEVMYHPPGDDPGLEWVELYNQMSVDMDISGWRLDGAAHFRFPTNSVLPANGYVVVSGNPDRLRALIGSSNVFGPFTNRLSNSGETLILRNQSGRLLDEMTYRDEDPWPVGADGSGASLSKRQRFNASSPAANWRASAEPGGTPRRINFEEGDSTEPSEVLLVRADSTARWLVPRDGSLGTEWRMPSFNDSGWTSGSASIGYDTTPAGPTALGNIALGKKVIAGSGAYANNAFDAPDGAGDFTALNVTDGSTRDVFGQNYWLGRQGRVAEHFTLDLEKVTDIQEIHLRNTHNTQHNDRGTAEFEIWAAQTIDANKLLVNPMRILRSRLTSVMGLDLIPADVFTPANGLVRTNARYLRFVALSANNAGNNVGLNEIEVYAPTFIEPDRVYPFDGSVSDVSGHGFHGENSGARFSTNVPAVFTGGQSLQFDGVSSQVAIQDPFDPEAYTISLWVNVETVRSSSVVLRTDPSGTRSSWSHQLRINSAGRFEHYLFDGMGRAVTATNIVVAGTWNHVAIIAANGGTMRIYVNGVPSGASLAIGNLWSGGDQWRIGSDAGNAASFLHGKIDDVAIWHSVLDDGAIRALAQGRSPSGGFHGFFGTDLGASLLGLQTTAYLRIPFEASPGARFGRLTMRARYADGFVAFLNAVEIVRRNAPATLSWNSAASIDRAGGEALATESIDLTGYLSHLTTGTNLLAIQALNASVSDPAFLFAADLVAETARSAGLTNVAFSEVAGILEGDFFVELENRSEGPIQLAGASIVSSRGGLYRFPPASFAANSFVTLIGTNLGFSLQDGDRLFLLGAGGELVDALEIHNRGRGRKNANPDAPWYYTSTRTPGATNAFSFRREIVINEIMYHHQPIYRTRERGFDENEEQWIELYNTSSNVVDLAGWTLDGEIAYLFPPGTVLAPDNYLVIARDALQLRSRYPAVNILGNFQGLLSHHSALVILRDPAGNPADEVRYHNSHPWPGYANGGGSSLELRDPRSDNAAAESWGASDESSRSQWRRYSYRAAAVRPVYTPSIYSFHEFRMGLLDEGEALIDNVTVTEYPVDGTPRQLLQNPDFAIGTQRWRLLGNHSHSSVRQEGEPSNPVLHLVATGNTSYLDNRLETTLKVGSTLVPVVTGREYEIAFDAKWLAGSPQLHTELYYNKVTATTVLDTPSQSGTPGRRNSIHIANAGPTYSGLAHTPVIPKAGEAVQVQIEATDPDGVGAVALLYSINGGTWREVAMALSPGSPDRFSATVPGQVSGAVIHFYVRGTDTAGAQSTYPGRGASSRALIKVDSTRLTLGKQTFRTIITPADSTLLHSAINMMSDDLLGCTVVHQEREVFYDARIRLHGSMFSRNSPADVGMTVKFPADHRFRGSRESVIVRRRGLIESMTKHILNAAGGLPGNYDDVVHLVSHRSDNQGTARLNLANYDDTYVESQFEGDDNGTVFKLEGIREYQTTQNGNPEGLKLSQPIGWIQSFDIANLGDDPEQYRWGIMIQSDRKRDDYSSIVRMGKAFSLTGTPLKQAAQAAIDVDEWARLFALQNLLGIGDVYGVENPHNFAFYVRPSDGRVVGLQNDWEFAFGASTSGSIYGSKNVYKVLRLPGFQRAYQGHLLDLLDSVVNSAYLTPWARHYTAVYGQSFNSVPSYVSARGTSVRSQLAARVNFEITSNGGLDFTVGDAAVTLQGQGWIDVYRVQRVGNAVPLELDWLDNQRWQARVPLESGTNTIQLVAFNYRGVQVGSDTISVRTTATDFPQRDYLRVSEIMYHPGATTLAEANAGFANDDDFEFIELVNQGPVPVSLSGVRFTSGVLFDFSTGAVTNLAPAGRVLAVKRKAAFELRYGTNLPVAGEFDGNLANGGELIRLIDSAGAIIQEFTYGDSEPWPSSADGLGRSLELWNLDGNWNDGANWKASAGTGGSPGREALPQVTIEAINFVGGQLELTFRAAAGIAYEVLVCEDLSSSTWAPLQVMPAQTISRIERVTHTPSERKHFYRIVSH